jgi:hypothetical protein
MGQFLPAFVLSHEFSLHMLKIFAWILSKSWVFGVPTVFGVLAFVGVPAIVSLPMFTSVMSLLSPLLPTMVLVKQNVLVLQQYTIRLSDHGYRRHHSNHWNTECRTGDFEKLSDYQIMPQSFGLSDSDWKKNYRLPSTGLVCTVPRRENILDKLYFLCLLGLQPPSPPRTLSEWPSSNSLSWSFFCLCRRRRVNNRVEKSKDDGK